MIGYMWLNKMNWTQINNFTGLGENCITIYIGFYRQLVSLALDNEDTQIGGEGIIVEIDETKFVKRKYNRGHRVEGFGVFGGVERTEARKFFVIKVPDRTRITLEELILTHIKAGSIIHSDCWASYNELNLFEFENNLRYHHLTVNHSVEFVTDAGVNTNTIEGTWSALKRVVPKKCDNIDLNECLLEHVWRRKNHKNLWDQLITAIAKIRY